MEGQDTISDNMFCETKPDDSFSRTVGFAIIFRYSGWLRGERRG